MKRIYQSFLFFLLLVSSISFNANATHSLGGDITYQHIQGNQYEVQLRLYYDCAGVSPPQVHTICFSSVATGFFYSLNISQSGPPVEIVLNPNLPVVTSTCNGGTGYGAVRIIYSGTINLPGASDDWIVSFTDIMNPPMNNNNPNFYGFYLSTKIDNMNYPGNSSVSFQYDPLFIQCLFQPNWDNLSATDADGDLIQYSLVTILTDTFFCFPQPMLPVAPTVLHPTSSTPPIFIHPNDGYVMVTPDLIEVSFISVMAEEIRNGTVINETVLSHQIKTLPFCISTGLNELHSDQIIIAPNPVTGIIKISTDLLTDKSELSIQNSLGEQLHLIAPESQQLNEWIVDVKDLSPGVYFISVSNSQSRYCKRFVKL